MIEFLLGVMVVSFMLHTIPSAVADAVATWRASKAGEFDFIDKGRERRATRQERWGKAWQSVRAARHRKAGGDGNYRAGAGAYFGDVYHGFWERGLEKRKAKADARGPYVYDPDAPTLGQRVTAAVGDKVQRLRETRLPESVRRAGHLLVDPVGEKRPESRRSYLDDVEPERGRDRYRYRAPDDDLFALADQLDEPQRPDIRHEDTTTGNPPADEGDTTVSAEAAVVAGSAAGAATVSGDGLNYEAIVAEHEHALENLKQQLDQATAVDNHLTATLAAIEGMDSGRQATATTTTALMEGMEERRLDGPSLEGAASAAEALTADSVASTQEHIEESQRQNQQWMTSLEASTAAVEGSLNHFKGMYGEAAATVQETGVDARMLQVV